MKGGRKQPFRKHEHPAKAVPAIFEKGAAVASGFRAQSWSANARAAEKGQETMKGIDPDNADFLILSLARLAELSTTRPRQ
jgi:hypothetical protein